MATQFEPEIGSWYKNSEGLSFEVIALDDGTVEIQYFDGAIEELDIDSWYEMDLAPREPPEDWTGPFDELERDDRGELDEAVRPQSWSGPLDTLEWD